MSKTTYETPSTRILTVGIEGMLLTSTRSVEAMRSVTGSWAEDDDE